MTRERKFHKSSITNRNWIGETITNFFTSTCKFFSNVLKTEPDRSNRRPTLFPVRFKSLNRHSIKSVPNRLNWRSDRQIGQAVKVIMGLKVLVYILLEFLFFLFILVTADKYKSMLWQ